MELMQQEIKKALLAAHCCSLLMIDVDRFREVNNRHGRSAGDQVLKELADIIRDEGVREKDIVGRYGSDAFVILMPGTDAGHGQAVAERLRERIAAFPFPDKDRSFHITASIGVAGCLNPAPVFGPTAIKDVFISYAREDRERIAPLLAHLEEKGVPLWIDRQGIDVGESFAETITNAIRGCRVLVVAISRHSVASHHVRKEVALASDHGKPILPLYLDQVPLPAALEYLLAGIHHIPFADGEAPNRFGPFMEVLKKHKVRTLDAANLASEAEKMVVGTRIAVRDCKKRGGNLVSSMPTDGRVDDTRRDLESEEEPPTRLG